MDAGSRSRGLGVAAIAGEVAEKKVAKVYDIESARLEPYTPDAFAHALQEFLAKHPAKLVLMPHTYQVRDFVPEAGDGPANHGHQRRDRGQV